MSLGANLIRTIVKNLILGIDHRGIIVNLIDAEFLNYACEYLKKVMDAKHAAEGSSEDWYRKEFLAPDLPSNEILIHAGLNKKTVMNIYGSARKDIVIEASEKQYSNLKLLIDQLTQQENRLQIEFTLQCGNKILTLTTEESFIVINTLAVKRSQLRGGAWSSLGKKTERPLMLTLCKLFSVPTDYYLDNFVNQNSSDLRTSRDVDFILIGPDAGYKCEVKLMGKGNPESADAAFARESTILIADKLSELNKNQLDEAGIHWVELNGGGFRRFGEVLTQLDIPNQPPSGKVELELNQALDQVFI